MLNKAAFQRCSEVGGLDGVEIVVVVDAAQNGVGIVIGHLAAVGAVDLVAVILGGVVAGSDHNACLAAQLTHGKAEHGNGHETVIEIDLNAVCCENLGGLLRKLFAVVAAVVAHSDAALTEHVVDIVGKTLSRSANGVDVHAVGANLQHAAHTRGAEGELCAEAVFDSIFIARNCIELGDQSGVGYFFKPKGIFFCSVHAPPPKFIVLHSILLCRAANVNEASCCVW